MDFITGDEYKFYNGYIYGGVCVSVTNDTYAILYQTNVITRPTFVMAAVRNGLELSFSSAKNLSYFSNYEANNDQYSALGMCLCGPNNVMTKWVDESTGKALYRIASLSGTSTPDAGEIYSELLYEGGMYGDPCSIVMDSDSVSGIILCCHEEHASVLTINGTEIIDQSDYTQIFENNNIVNTTEHIGSGLVLSFSKGDTPLGETYSISVDGTTVTKEVLNSFVANPADPDYLSSCLLHDDQTCGLVWRDANNSNKGNICHVSVSETTPIYGTPQIWSSGQIRCPSIFSYGDDNIGVVYIDTEDSDKLKIIRGTLSGTVFTFPEDPIVVHDAATTHVHRPALQDDRYLMISYRDADDSNKGKAVIVDVVGSPSNNMSATVGGHQIFANIWVPETWRVYRG